EGLQPTGLGLGLVLRLAPRLALWVVGFGEHHRPPPRRLVWRPTPRVLLGAHPAERSVPIISAASRARPTYSAACRGMTSVRAIGLPWRDLRPGEGARP